MVVFCPFFLGGGGGEFVCFFFLLGLRFCLFACLVVLFYFVLGVVVAPSHGVRRPNAISEHRARDH